MRPVSIIVAVDSSGGFGKDGKIPWDFPEDMVRFKRITNDSICIMGRKTYEDIFHIQKERRLSKGNHEPIIDLLSGRRSIVLTRDNRSFEGAETSHSLREAVEVLCEDDSREIFVIGGEKLFIEALGWTTTIYMTLVKDHIYRCDRFFPLKYVYNYFTVSEQEQTDSLFFLTYKRVKEA